MKDRVISIRVSEEEYEHFAKMAKKDFRTLSEYMRLLLTKTQKTKKKRESIDPDFKTAWFNHYGREYRLPVAQSQALINIKKKFEKDFPDHSAIDLFTVFLAKLPEFYKTKGIETVNSKFYELIAEIRTGTTNRKFDNSNVSLSDILFTEDDL